jgi:ABC-type antimicrobial peptide transport system permease subunit
MTNFDVCSMSVRSLLKRKLRTFLTILGVVIGTASIVVMISLGLAVNDRFDKEIQNMGDVSMVNVYNFAWQQEGRPASKSPPILDDNVVNKIRRIKGVEAATPLLNMSLYLKSGRYVMPYVAVYGIDPAAMSSFGYGLQDGRLLEPGDKYGVVFGAKTELRFYKPAMNVWYSDRFEKDNMGEETSTLVDIFHDKILMSTDGELVYPSDQGNKKLKPITVKCVGLLESKDYQTDSSIFMDIKIVQKLRDEQQRREQSLNQSYGYFSSLNNNRNTGYENVIVKCADIEHVKQVAEEIRSMGFYSEFPTESLDSLQSMTTGMQAMLGAIGAVSMLVAAIGIANTMVMSIYERTREIGVMKVIGAALTDIRKMFLLEAALIGLTGGVIGVLFSYSISYLLNNAQLKLFDAFLSGLGGEGAGTISLITPWLCITGIGFALMIGLVSGYFPARRAMRLSAISAIRTE